jgi:hypothetical protein
MSHYDDNFGFSSDEGGDTSPSFRRYVSRNSVRKVCRGCGYSVRLLPHYVYCDQCSTIREQGGELPNPQTSPSVDEWFVDVVEVRRHTESRKVHTTESRRISLSKSKWDSELEYRRQVGLGNVPRPKSRRRPQGN